MLFGIGPCHCAYGSVGDVGRSICCGIADVGVPRIDVPGDFMPVCLGRKYSANLLCRNRRCRKARNIGERKQILGDAVKGAYDCL